MQNNQHVMRVVRRVQGGEGFSSAVSWVWFHQMTAADKRFFASERVMLRHPLASQPGTQQWRFSEVCKDALTN